MEEESKPRWSIRATTFYGWAIPLFLVFSYFNYSENIDFNPYVLALLCLVLVGVGMPEFLRIIRLENKRESKLVTIAISLVAIVVMISLLELKRRDILVWNELYISVPILIFSIATFLVCFVSEDRHIVQIYFALDGFHFIRTI